MSNEKGNPGYFPPVKVNVPIDEFENTIRAYGISAASEWFYHQSGSDFTEDTIKYFKYLSTK